MIPASDKGRFYAFGRVFAGRIATGRKVRLRLRMTAAGSGWFGCVGKTLSEAQAACSLHLACL